MDTEKGSWKTIRGHRIFIKDGQSVSEAFAENTKRRVKYRHKTFKLSNNEYSRVMHELSTYHSSFKDKKICSKFIGKHYYVFENNGFNEYHIVERLKIETNQDKINFLEDIINGKFD